MASDDIGFESGMVSIEVKPKQLGSVAVATAVAQAAAAADGALDAPLPGEAEIELVETVVEATDELWENCRYYPMIGWSSRLLPSDRCTATCL